MIRRISRNGGIQNTLSIVADLCGIVALLLTLCGLIVPSIQKYILIAITFILLLLILTVLLKRELPFDDLYASYRIDVMNCNGDVIIQRNINFKNSSRLSVSEREHSAFSDSSEVDRFSELNVNAWDKEGHMLPIEVKVDKPFEKRFLIKFSKTIKANDTYAYGYRFSWPRFFPSQDEVFTAMDICPNVEFIVHVHDGITLKRFLCKERYPDGRSAECEEIERTEDLNNKIYNLCIVKKDRFNKIDLHLTFNKQK